MAKFWTENSSGHFHVIAKGSTPWKWIVLSRWARRSRNSFMVTLTTSHRAVQFSVGRYTYHLNIRWYDGTSSAYAGPARGIYWPRTN